jgi:ERF superfamily
MSEQTPGLLNAMLAVQAEAPTLRKDAVNPAFRSKYTPLDTIVETIGPLLTKHELVWTTLPVAGENGPALFYRLAHVPTGETLDGTMPLLLGKADSQGLGSAITYARRYSLCAVLNLVADEDDDGNGARGSGAGSVPSGRTSDQDAASEKQLDYLKSLLVRVKPDEHVLRAMLKGVDADGVNPTKDGWSKALKRDQVSRLIETLKSGILPTGTSDIPSDLEPLPVVAAGGDVPFSVDDPDAGEAGEGHRS